DGRERTTLDDLHGLYKRDPFAAGALVVFMASLIGVPPTAGFIGKLFIFSDALQAHLGWLAIILAINSIISISYYLAIARAAFVAEETEERSLQPNMGSGVFSAAAICAVAVFLISVLTGPLMNWMAPTVAGVEAKAPATKIVVEQNR